MLQSNIKDMTTSNPVKLILSFSFPVLIGNLVQQLYNMADTIIVGQCLGSDALAAVGTTGPLCFLILGFVFGITSGIAVIAAQRFGAKDEEGLKKSVAMSIMLCVGLTLIITLLSVFLAKPLLHMINTPEEIFQDAYDYIVVIFIGIFSCVLYNMIACLLRALGDSKTPLYFLLISSFLNIGLDYLCIATFGWGVAGAAWATVFSQFLSGILCLIYVKVKYPILHVKRSDFSWNTRFAWKHLAIGLPMALQFSITAIGCIILQGALNLFGKDTIAAYTAANKVEQLVTVPAGSFGVTMANYAGQNLGANRIDRIKEGVRKSCIITVAFSVGAAACVYLLSRPLLALFNIEYGSAIMDEALYYLKLTAVFYPALFLIFIYRNVLQGIGRSFMPLMAGFFELFARAVASAILPIAIGYAGVCLAGPIAWLSAAIPLAISYVIIIRKVK